MPYQEKFTYLNGILLKDLIFSRDQADHNFQFFSTFEDDVKALQEIKLQNTPTFKKFAVNPLKTATQKVEGFMKWGYAKAEELEAIGGDELVKHANSSKIALGAGALVAGAGVGTLAYFLLNKPKSTTAKPPSAE